MENIEKPKDYLEALKECLKDFKSHKDLMYTWQFDIIEQLLNNEIKSIIYIRQF